MRTALAAMAAALAAGPWMASEAATPSPCRLRGVEHPAQCLALSRPLDPTRANGPAIELHVAVLPALSRHKKPDPVFFIAGGPGQSAIELAGQAARLLGRLGQRRDIVLVDQRGTGRSAPLTCEEDRSDALDRRVDPVAMRQALARCRTALQQLPHGDLRHYATPVAVQDLEAVRRHLGLERVNVVGVSYGTRVALEWLRQSPGAVRRAVLDGVSPPDQALPASSVVDARAAFDALLAWCRGDAACSRAHPDLADTWQALRAAPARTATVAHPLTGRPQVLTLDADRLDALVRAALYTPVLASALPHALAEAAAGHPAALLGLATALSGGRTGGIAWGMHFAVVCSEDQPLVDALPPGPSGPFAALGAWVGQTCADWPRAALPEGYRAIPRSAAPVLLLSGGIDPVTPPRHGERVAAALGPKARHVVLPQLGHGVLAQACARDLAARFIDADDDAAAAAAGPGCDAPVPRPPLFRPPGGASAP